MKKLLLFVLITTLCLSAFAMGAKEDADYSVLNPTNVKYISIPLSPWYKIILSLKVALSSFTVKVTFLVINFITP